MIAQISLFENYRIQKHYVAHTLQANDSIQDFPSEFRELINKAKQQVHEYCAVACLEDSLLLMQKPAEPRSTFSHHLDAFTQSIFYTILECDPNVIESNDFRVVLSVSESKPDWSFFCVRPEYFCEIILSFSLLEYFLCEVTSSDF